MKGVNFSLIWVVILRAISCLSVHKNGWVLGGMDSEEDDVFGIKCS